MTTAKAGPIAILSAMQEELGALLARLEKTEEVGHGLRTYFRGRLEGRDCVLAWSRWGKVAAAATVTEAIARFNVSEVVFAGTCGGIKHGVHVGDVVVADEVLQHDLDARPIMARYEIPGLGVTALKTDAGLSAALAAAAESFLAAGLAGAVTAEERSALGIVKPAVHRGLVVTGDQIFATAQQVARLRDEIPHALVTEMEGAAVAQVCFEYGIPFGLVRVVSDSADEHAPGRFAEFVKNAAGAYSTGIVTAYLANHA